MRRVRLQRFLTLSQSKKSCVRLPCVPLKCVKIAFFIFYFFHRLNLETFIKMSNQCMFCFSGVVCECAHGNKQIAHSTVSTVAYSQHILSKQQQIVSALKAHGNTLLAHSLSYTKNFKKFNNFLAHCKHTFKHFQRILGMLQQIFCC